MQSELSIYEGKLKKDEHASEIGHSNSKLLLKSNEKSLSKKSLTQTPVIFGANDGVNSSGNHLLRNESQSRFNNNIETPDYNE